MGLGGNRLAMDGGRGDDRRARMQAVPEMQRCPAEWLWRNPRRCLVCSLRRAGCGRVGMLA